MRSRAIRSGRDTPTPTCWPASNSTGPWPRFAPPARRRERAARGGGRAGAQGPADPGLRLRIVEARSARAELAEVYDLALAERPGLYARTEPWWDRLLTDLHSDGGSSRPIRCLLAGDDSGPRGFAVFTSAERWDEDAGLPEGVLEVNEAIATDPAATAALWGNLLSQDVLSGFHARMRPVDDPLLYLLADPRRSPAPGLHLLPAPRAAAGRAGPGLRHNERRADLRHRGQAGEGRLGTAEQSSGLPDRPDRKVYALTAAGQRTRLARAVAVVAATNDA